MLVTWFLELKEKKSRRYLDGYKNTYYNIITGFEDVKPMVLLDLPVDTEDYEELRNSMENYSWMMLRCIFYRKLRTLGLVSVVDS
jgi:translation elongation factor EF-4